MVSILLPEPLPVCNPRAAAVVHRSFSYHLPCPLLLPPGRRLVSVPTHRLLGFRRSLALAATRTLMSNSVPVGLVSDYDLLALDSILGGTPNDTSLFPEVDSSWKTFNEIQKLLSKTNGKLVGDLMTPAPVVVRETTNLEDAARILLETKYRRLPVVDVDGKLVGIITRGNVVRAALKIKRASEMKA